MRERGGSNLKLYLEVLGNMADSTTAKNEFVRLCAMQPATDMTLANIRKIVLYQTQGLCPVHKLIDVNDGSMRNAKSVCAATAEDVKSRRQFWRSWRTSMDQHVHKLMMREQTALSKQRMLTALQMSRLEALIAAHHSHQNLAAFRLAILESASPAFSVRAIHFFRWDGNCRSSPEEIQRAMMRYASTKQGMSLAWKVALGVTLAASVLAGVRMRSRSRDHPLPSSTTEDRASTNESAGAGHSSPEEDRNVRLMVATFREHVTGLHVVGRSHWFQEAAHNWNYDVPAAQMRSRMVELLKTLDESLQSWTEFLSMIEDLPHTEMKPFMDAVRRFRPVNLQGSELKEAMSTYFALSETNHATTVRETTASLATKLRDALRHDEKKLRTLHDWLRTH